MAMDKKTPDDSEGRKPNDSGGGLGNLPPLSDFDSSGTTSDSDLPPIGAFDSDSGKEKGFGGGLPPIDKIPVETPRPTGGNIKAPPPGFETPSFESPGFETPAGSKRKERTGFQDIAADSDFSPETPEIGPGPEGDIDTPMFDSAFGNAGAAGGFSPMFETPAPTQAMETPMFGDTGKVPPGPAGFEPPQFDEAAFQPGSDFGGGTPVPDFSPDTAFPTAGAPAAAAGPAAIARTPLGEPPKAKKAKGGPKSPLVTAAIVIVAFIVGAVAGPFISTQLSFMPNPLKAVVAGKDTEIAKLNQTIKNLQTPSGGGEVKPVTREELDNMIAQRDKLTAEIAEITKNREAAQAEFDKTSANLNQARAELDNTNEEYVKAQEAFEDLQNQTAIVQARQLGLAAEVDRLTGMVGTLEEANTRSQATRDGLAVSVDRLMIQIKEGIPLTPEKYSRDRRLAAVEELKAKVALAKWVTPALLDEYTNLYRQELEIAASNAYFFAKIPGQDKFGATYQIWAECLMKGNYAVYFRSIDGNNIGIYQNVAKPGENPDYAFRLDLPDDAKKSIEQEVIASRTKDYEQKLQTLVEKQVVTDGSVTPFQRAFNSL